MSDPSILTPDELALVADNTFFRAKATITPKVRAMLEEVHDALKQELAGVKLLVPPGFDPAKSQYVKGEHLEHYPYQYLDFPKHFEDDDKCTFRTLFWWGHYVVFALILEGQGLLQYKKNLINRYGDVADRDLHLYLAPSLWEWKRGQGYTLPLTRDRKPEVAAILTDRPFFKLARFVPLDDPIVRDGRLAEAARVTLNAMLPVIAKDVSSRR